MFDNKIPQRLAASKTMRDAYYVLLSCPSLGRFLAFQLLIDLNYGPLLDFNEMDFVIAGPGALDGIFKCFVNAGEASAEDTIRAMVEISSGEFQRLGLTFTTLWGRHLQPIDCQNIFCEVEKYSRYAHPEIRGRSRRARIKQRYRPNAEPLSPAFPAKWHLTGLIPGLPAPRAV